MKSIPEFIVMPLLQNDEMEQDPRKGCLIIINSQDRLAEFADYLEKNSLLSVTSLRREQRFFFTVGSFYSCGVLEVHLKEDVERANHFVDCEQIAIAETYSYLRRETLLT